ARANRLIKAAGAIRSDAGIGVSNDLKGTHVSTAVKLGTLRVDDKGRLLVLGGDIVSAADPVNSGIGDSFYNNPNWHDDVADGPVAAKVTLPGGAVAQIDPAWVV